MLRRKSYVAVLVVGLLMLLIVILSTGRSVSESPANHEDSPEAQVAVTQQIRPVKVPENVYFADERVPLRDFDVHDRLDRELLVNTYWHSNSIQLLKRASRLFPIIEPILEKNGVPDDFKYLAAAESGLLNAVSHRDAAGIWQFLEGTAREYGLVVDKTVDERYNLEKSTEAACKYLKASYEDLGSWSLAAASYNMGRPRLKRIIESQKVNSYYDLYLNDETSRYVFRIIALKELFNAPEKYGFYLDEADLYDQLKVRSVSVDTSITDLADFAIANGTTYKTLKLLNPWLREPTLVNTTKRAYEIKLPI